MNWEKYSYVISSPNRTEVLKLLINEKTPKEIVTALKKSDSNISRALSQLEEEEIIKCLTPSQKRGRLYIATDIGKEILKKLSE